MLLSEKKTLDTQYCFSTFEGNKAHPAKPERPFPEGDPRIKFCVKLDPRIHFALVCGAKVQVDKYSHKKMMIRVFMPCFVNCSLVPR